MRPRRHLTALALAGLLLLPPGGALAAPSEVPLAFTLPANYPTYNYQDFRYTITAAAGPLRLTASHYLRGDVPLFAAGLADPVGGELLDIAYLTSAQSEASLVIPAAGTYDLWVRPFFEPAAPRPNPGLTIAAEGLQTNGGTPSCINLTDFPAYTIISSRTDFAISPCNQQSAYINFIALGDEVLHQSGAPDGGQTHTVTIDPAQFADGIYVLDVEAASNLGGHSSYTSRSVMIDQEDQYTDVPRSHWARQPVELMSHFAILSGRGNGEFDPDDPVLRKEFAKMVALTFELPLEGAGPSPFADAPNDWSQPYIDALYEAGLVQGEIVDGQRYFRPDRRISRAEAVTIIGRALAVDQTDISILPALFLDDAEIPAWAMPSIAVLSVWRWISGFPDGEFHPHGELQRAQAAKILAHELGLVPSDVDSGAPRPEGFDTGWSHHLGGPERTSFSPGALADASVEPIWASNVRVEGGLAAGDGLLFIGATRGRVYALVPGSGGRIWQTQVDARADEMARLAFSPSQNLVYAAVFGQVAALHPVTGRKVWTYDTPVLPVTRPVVAGDRLFFAGQDPRALRTLFALDAATGTLLWKRPESNVGTPAVSGDRLFVSQTGALAVAYDVRDGALLWRRERSDEPPTQYPPVVAHGLVFVVDTASHKLFALDEVTGAPIWESTAHGPVAVDDRYVWAPQAGSQMLLLNPATGATEATLDLCGTAPVIGATHAFVACGGNILAIDRTTLEIQPVAPGMQVLGLDEGQVYYLTEDPSPISLATLAALGAPDIPSPASALATDRDRAAATASFTRSSGTNGRTQP